MEKTTRCTDCAAEFTEEELEGAQSCPACGSVGLPCAIAQDVTIKINWHELRILTIWASNWAAQHDLSLDTIIKRLEAQRPDGSFAPLTVAGELREIASVYDTTVELHRDGQTTVFKPPSKN